MASVAASVETATLPAVVEIGTHVYVWCVASSISALVSY